MNNKELDGRVQQAFSHICPDVRENIMEGLGSPEPGSGFSAPAPRRKNLKRFLQTAAVLLLFIAGIGGIGLYGRAYAVSAAVLVDVNPSVELLLNRGRRVLSVKALNEEALPAEELELRGLQIEPALELLAESFMEQGYLSADKNSLLISVSGRDAQALSEELSNELYASLSEKGLSASVMSQTLTEEPLELSGELSLSPGKAKLVSAMESLSPGLSAQALAELSINELNLLLELQELEPQNLSVLGSASLGMFVGEEAARLSAEADIGIGDEQIKNFSISLAYEDGAIVYELSFDSGIYSYSCSVDALSGIVSRMDEGYSQEFSQWLSRQGDDIKSWVSENTDRLRHWAENGGDWQELLQSLEPEISALAGDIVQGLFGLLESILS